MANMKPLVIPILDAMEIALCEERARNAQQLLSSHLARKYAIMKRNGLLGMPIGIAAEPDGPHPVGTVLDAATGKPFMVSAEDGQPGDDAAKPS